MKREADLTDCLLIETYQFYERRKFPDPFEVCAEREQDQKIRAALSRLTPREEYVLSRRFGIGEFQTLDNLAAEFDLSRERLRQIEAKANRKFERFFGKQIPFRRK